MRDTAAETPTPDAPALDPREERYCAARAGGATVGAAAREAGVCEATAHVWNKRPEIVARIDALLAPVTADVLRHFRTHAMRAAERVTECIEPGRGGATGDLNFKAALAVLRFVGAEPATRQEVKIEDGTLTDEQRAERIAQLLDAARARRTGPAAGDE